MATLGAAGFFGGSTTACGVAAGVAATRAGATVTVYDDGGACAQIDDRSARFGVGRDCSGSRDKRGTANAAPTIDDASQHEPRPPCQSVGERRWTRREDFAGDVTCSAAGGVFPWRIPPVRAGFPQVAQLDRRRARQSRSTRLFRGLVAPADLMTAIRMPAGCLREFARSPRAGYRTVTRLSTCDRQSDPPDERDSSASTIDNLDDLGHDISKCRHTIAEWRGRRRVVAGIITAGAAHIGAQARARFRACPTGG